MEKKQLESNEQTRELKLEEQSWKVKKKKLEKKIIEKLDGYIDIRKISEESHCISLTEYHY